MKRIIFLVFLVTQWLHAQNHTVKGVFIDSLHQIQNIALYQLDKGDVKYIKYTVVKKDTFSIAMDSLETGYYRAFYKNVKTGYVDFIYNNEDVLFTVHSKVGQESVSFLASKENQLLDSYKYNMSKLQYKLDSVQLAYFEDPVRKTKKKHKKIKVKIDGAQKYYENLAKDDYCLGEIKASKIYNAPEPFPLPHDYVESLITHYFDFIDFSDERLRNTSLLTDKISEYIFQLHQADDVEMQNQGYMDAINLILSKTDEDSLKGMILEFVIKKIVAQDNNEVLQQTLTLYKGLPKSVQKITFVKETEMFAKVLLGVKAPNIEISKEETLYDLQGSDKYLVVFWSSTCSHCLKELPEVKKLLIDHPEITVVAVGLEKQKEKNNWIFESSKFKGWKHAIALGKWKSKAANNYNIHATPSYFLLNKEKRIIAKPDDVEELELIVKSN